MGGVVDTLLFQPPTPPTPIRLRASSNSSAMELVWLKTIHGSKIPALFLQRKYAIYTILYSHGNAEDLGMLSNYLADLSKILHVNILAYDYTGYGFSNRKLSKTGNFQTASSPPALLPSEEHFYADISAAYDYLVTIRGIPAHRIILFGRSIGSGPSCYLASKLNANKKRSEIGGCESSAAGLCTSCASLEGSVIFDDLSLELNHGAEQSNNSEYIAGLILHSPFACKFFYFSILLVTIVHPHLSFAQSASFVFFVKNIFWGIFFIFYLQLFTEWLLIWVLQPIKSHSPTLIELVT